MLKGQTDQFINVGRDGGGVWWVWVAGLCNTRANNSPLGMSEVDKKPLKYEICNSVLVHPPTSNERTHTRAYHKFLHNPVRLVQL